MTEWMLRDASKAHDLAFVTLRYFNVAGADPKGRTGQSTPKATQLIKVACEAAVGLRDGVTVFGEDYDTPDGTCIRDYIHVSDLADAHVAALKYLEAGGGSRVLNCGYGHGFSVRQVLETVQQVSGRDLAIRPGPRRAGDPPSLADAPALRTVWLEVIEAAKGKGLGGEAIGLRGATVRELDGAVLNLGVPPGLAQDLAAFLDDRVRSAGFRAELGGRIGVAPDRLEFVIDDAGPRRRVTAEVARDQKLEQMMETDPRLREAVQALDLKSKE